MKAKSHLIKIDWKKFRQLIRRAKYRRGESYEDISKITGISGWSVRSLGTREHNHEIGSETFITLCIYVCAGLDIPIKRVLDEVISLRVKVEITKEDEEILKDINFFKGGSPKEMVECPTP